MTVDEAKKIIEDNYNYTEGSLLCSLHEYDDFSEVYFRELYDSIACLANNSVRNDELTIQVVWCYRIFLKSFIYHFDPSDLAALTNVPDDPEKDIYYSDYIEMFDNAVFAYLRGVPCSEDN